MEGLLLDLGNEGITVGKLWDQTEKCGSAAVTGMLVYVQFS
jgi:hypothetical protein